MPFPLVLKAEFFSLLVMEVKNFVYGAFVGLEGVAVARDGVRDALQEG